jgi:hypothetical protein
LGFDGGLAKTICNQIGSLGAVERSDFQPASA